MYDIIIIGMGISGITAAIYAKRSNKKVLIIALVLLAITLERTILGFFQASSIVHNSKLKCILERGLINTLRQFGKNFSYNFVLIVCVFFINAFCVIVL